MVLLHPQVKPPWKGKMCHFSSATVLVAEICPLWMRLFHHLLAPGLSGCNISSTLLPARQQNVLYVVFFPSSPDQSLTWMALFSDSFKAFVCLIWIPGISPSLSSLSPFFTRDPLLVSLMLSHHSWGDAEGLVLLWGADGCVDVAFHQPFCKQPYGPK